MFFMDIYSRFYFKENNPINNECIKSILNPNINYKVYHKVGRLTPKERLKLDKIQHNYNNKDSNFIGILHKFIDL